MPGALDVVVCREEEALEVPDENVLEREQGVQKERIDVLKPVHRRAGIMRGKAEEAAAFNGIIFAVEIDAGVVPAMVEDAPHVRADAAQVEDVVQRFVDAWAL